MVQIKEGEDLIGKTIARIAEMGESLILVFNDNTYVIFDSSTDFDSPYHYSFFINLYTSIDRRLELGIIDEEEYNRLYREETLKIAKINLNIMKSQFPELF